MNDKTIGTIAIVAIAAAIGWAAMSETTRRFIGQLPIRLINRSPMVFGGQTISLEHHRLPIQLGDPVFAAIDSVPTQVGFVRGLGDDQVELQIDRTLTFPTFAYHQTRGSLSEATALLLPPQKRAAVTMRLSEWARANGRQMISGLIPIIETAMAKSVPVLERGVRQSLHRHEEDVAHVADNFKNDVIHGRLIPLAQTRLLPIVRQHGDEPARVIGRQLWDRASLWGFAWRAVLDTSGLPRDDLVAQEWSRFVDEEAIPVIEQNSELIAQTLTRVIADAASDKGIRNGLSDAAESIANDPQTRALLQTVLKESIAQNVELRQVWTDALTSPAADDLFVDTAATLEPVVREIGDIVLGTADGGISEGLTRVLRSQVLGRDRRWIVATEHAAEIDDVTAGRLEYRRQPALLPPVHLVGRDE